MRNPVTFQVDSKPARATIAQPVPPDFSRLVLSRPVMMLWLLAAVLSTTTTAGMHGPPAALNTVFWSVSASLK